MIPKKVHDYINEYICQEIYIQVAIIKGKEKISLDSAIIKYLNSNHFNDLSKGRPYNHFLEGLKDKCLIKLKNSPMRNFKTDDKEIKNLQKKLNELSIKEINNTFWEVETGEFLSKEQIKEIENERDYIISRLNLSKEVKKENILKMIMIFCENYEKLCQKKYPDASLPLNLLR